jgi:hypothetical protein
MSSQHSAKLVDDKCQIFQPPHDDGLGWDAINTSCLIYFGHDHPLTDRRQSKRRVGRYKGHLYHSVSNSPEGESAMAIIFLGFLE